MSVRQAVPNLRKTGSHGEPHAPPALHWSLQETSFFPEGTWQAPSPQCNSADCAIYATTPCALHPGRSLAQTLLWLLTVPPGTPQFPLTTCHRPQHPTRRGVRALAPPPTQGRFSPSSSERHPMLRHCGPPPSCEPSRPAAKGTPWWCRWPTERRQRWSDHQRRSPINGLPPSMSRFLTMTFVNTRPPPSLHTCAAARSSANPLAPRTPASAHAARWWPRQSRRRPHRQVREEKGRGRWRRRHNNTRKGCGSIRVDRDVGNAIRTLLARGPLCDLHNARSGSVKLGQTTRATLCSCTARAAGFCHPCFGSTGFSSSSFCPGRNPAKTASPTLAPQTVTPAAYSRIHARPRNLVLGGGTGVSPLLLPRPGAFASRSGCSQPNWPSAQPLPDAKHKPSPPKFIGTPAALLACAESPAMPTK